MNERLSDEERQALIAEHASGPLAPDAANDLSLLSDLLADPSTWAEPAGRLEEAVVHGVEAAPTPTTAEPERAAASHDPSRRRRTFAMSVIAAAAVVAIVVGALALLRGSATPVYTAQLAATNVVPGAHGSADITHNNAGFRIALHARGLPKLPAGEYYQAWLKNTAGTLVPIGTFSSSDARVTLWSGVSPSLFPTLTVTIEKTDGNQQSSGRRVLAGEVHAG